MAKAKKKTEQVSLETVLWNCRVALRGVGSTEKIGQRFLEILPNLAEQGDGLKL